MSANAYWPEAIEKAWAHTIEHVFDGWAKVVIALGIFAFSALLTHKMRGADAAKDWIFDAVVGAISTALVGALYFLAYLLVVVPQDEHATMEEAVNQRSSLQKEKAEYQSELDLLKKENDSATDKLNTLAIAAGFSPKGGLNEKLDTFLSDFDATKKALSELKSQVGPPPRHFTSEQRSKLIDALKSFGKKSIAIRTARTPEAQDYGSEFESALREAQWEIRPPAFLFIEKEGTGLSVAVRDRNSPPDDGINFIRALAYSGIVTKLPMGSMEISGLKPDQFELYVGFPERETTK